MPRLSSYGLQIDSEFALTGLDCGDPGLKPDVVIRCVDRLGPPSPDAVALGAYWLSPGSLRVTVADLVTIDVVGGRRIDVLAETDADEASVRLYLQGIAMGVLLRQRGFLVLHANAIKISDGVCVLAVGQSGAGKSTLAGAFLARHHEVLADDVVAVADGQAQPGLRRLKLWQDAVDRLALPDNELRPLAVAPGKFEWAFDRPPIGPQRIACVYVLEQRAGSGKVSLEQLNGMRRFAPLSDHTYRPELIRSDDERSLQLSACGNLASRTRVVSVRRPLDRLSVDETIEAILADVNG